MNILIAEPNKVYLSLMKANLEKHLFFINCDIVGSLEDLKEKDSLKEYDLYISSDVLIDSEKEHLEYLKNKKFILVTNSDKIDENAIDYIRKSDISIINYLVKLVKRFQNNKYLITLLVDDDDKKRAYKKEILEKINLNVIDTKYLRDALRIIKNRPINFVIANVDSKDWNIIDFVKNMRKYFNYHKIPIILTTTIEDMPKTIEALKFGANTFIQKPFIKEAFISRINNILEIINFDIEDKETFIDSLTNTYNGFYLDILDNFSKMYNNKSVAIIKLNEFNKIKKKSYKKANERLVEFAEKIKELIRKNDILVRLYTDTFLLFMPNTDKKEAEIVVSKIRSLGFDFVYAISDEGNTLAEISKTAYERLK